MRSHRVWNDIHADNYASSKSFGGEFRQSIAVGSSATYSNHFANIEVREIPLNIGDWSAFILYLDGEQVKRSIFNNKTKECHNIAMDSQLTLLDAVKMYSEAA